MAVKTVFLKKDLNFEISPYFIHQISKMTRIGKKLQFIMDSWIGTTGLY